MRKLLIIILFATANLAQAQLTELGVFGGGTNFIGDVGPAWAPPQGWVAGITLRHQFNEYYGVRLMGNLGEISAADANSGQDYKKQRNLSFRSSIWEVGLLMEINFFEYVTGSTVKNKTPYIFGGISIFGFNPQAQFTDGRWYDLQPLGTEGQGSTLNSQGGYGLAGISIPFGLGYRISLSNSISMAVETGFRVTSTDYLDDAGGHYVNTAELAAESGPVAAYFADRSLSGTDKSLYPRADYQNKDWYVFTGIHLYIALTPKNERCKRF